MNIKDHDDLIHRLSLASAGATEQPDPEEIADVVAIHLKHPVEIIEADLVAKHSPFMIPTERYETPTGWIYLFHSVPERRTVFDPFRIEEFEGRYFFETPENVDFPA